MTQTTTSFCRVCMNLCPIEVETDGRRIISISGVRENQLYRGYTCIKGRVQADRYDHPQRLLRSLKRMPDGSYSPIATDDWQPGRRQPGAGEPSG